MKSLVQPLINRQAWMVEFQFQHYTPAEQDRLWDLMTRALEMQALDALLDHLNQHDQHALIQHLAEDELESQVETYLGRVLPNYPVLLDSAVRQCKEQLRRDLVHLSK